MKILLYSSVFWPSIGGVESITDTLATNLVQLGHECIVVTETPLVSQKEIERKYRIVRQPGLRERFSLARECDLIHSNGASVVMYPFARLAKKPFIWTHNGYQVSCVDGLGWVDGEPTPLTPISSLIYHFHRRGIGFFLRESFKLALRRYVANHVNLNIAATQWVAKRQPLRNQIVAYTPYPLTKFKAAHRNAPIKYDLIYVGRLVSEKGLPDLIQAFHLLTLIPEHSQRTLAIVGSGNMKSSLEKMVKEFHLENNIDFLGPKQGDELIDIISQAAIGVVPSAWEEPMGGVSLELLAAGKVLITSDSGGHAECVGKAGLKFKNRDYLALFGAMKEIIMNQGLFQQLQENAYPQIEAFDELKLTQKYVEIYDETLRKSV
jgi:glycosyltransferase involved in cell wall biosynthesis